MNYLKFLRSREYEVKFRWLDKKTEGLIEYDKELISINLQLLVVTVFVHEALHAEHPDWEEERVEEATYRQVEKMKVREIKQLAGEVLARRK